MLDPNISPARETEPQSDTLSPSQADVFKFLMDMTSNVKSSADGAVRSLKRLIVLLVLTIVTTVGLCLALDGRLPIGSDESQHPHWQHVQTASDRSTLDINRLTRLVASETPTTCDSIEVTRADANRSASRQLRSALKRNDIAAANHVLQAAQIAVDSPAVGIVLPDLESDPELVSAIAEGRKELFQIELFDCCQEDGDVVDVIVNGSPFATVPIMNAGTLLSMPLSSGENTITIQGSQDGRGGVTLSVRTSRGEFFARRMRVGEAYHLGVTVQ